jgi:hypothetical protein
MNRTIKVKLIYSLLALLLIVQPLILGSDKVKAHSILLFTATQHFSILSVKFNFDNNVGFHSFSNIIRANQSAKLPTMLSENK